MHAEHIRAHRLYVAVAIAILGIVLVAGVTTAIGGRPFSTTLTGEAEIPGPGDPDGTGVANLTLNQGQRTICYDLSVSGIEPATAAHIHEIDPNTGFGGIVVHLEAPADGSSSACASVLPELIKKIRQHPETYYVNVHNGPHPAGALRGDLSK
jgi:hypothetical protein